MVELATEKESLEQNKELINEKIYNIDATIYQINGSLSTHLLVFFKLFLFFKLTKLALL